MHKIDKQFSRLVEIMSILRGENGCPWDREQSHKSLRQHLLEEAYEVIETIDKERYDELAGELGDLLLQVVFHAQMASEEGRFDIHDVIQEINEKLIRRHPHVFGDAEINSAEEQVTHWEQLKLTHEGKKSAIDGVPKQLPALLRAFRMQKKASTVGFDWPEIQGVLDKIEEDVEPVWHKVAEEFEELREACTKSDEKKIEEEFGDLLFSLVNLSRFLKVNPEDALRMTIEKFYSRFRQVEQEFGKQGKAMRGATLEEMDEVWDRIKKEET